MKRIILAIVGSLFLITPSLAMNLSFSWGDIPKCTSGNPNRVTNPTFKLSGVPDGTKSIRFKLKDIDAPRYNHGGGTVDYKGNTIAPGAFKYKSPCPPSGRHTYEWTATARDGSGKSLAIAKSRKKYP